MSKSVYELLKEEAEKAMKNSSAAGDNQFKSAPYIAFGRALMACELEAITKAQFDAVFKILFNSKKQE